MFYLYTIALLVYFTANLAASESEVHWYHFIEENGVELSRRE